MDMELTLRLFALNRNKILNLTERQEEILFTLKKNGTQVRVTSPCLRLLATHLMKEKNTKIILLFPIGPRKDPGGLDLDTIN